LFNKRYLAASEYTIADMICYPRLELGDPEDRDRGVPEREALTRRNRRGAGRRESNGDGPEFRENPASISPDVQARRRKLVADPRAQPIPAEWLRVG
jgi:glutathione S-transferase